MSDGNQRQFTEEQLRAGQGMVGLLNDGMNKGASQSGQNFGLTRHIWNRNKDSRLKKETLHFFLFILSFWFQVLYISVFWYSHQIEITILFVST